ncbi:MAG: CorA family divalent cation transporter [Oscillospiraceae bacterium]
MLKYLLTKTLVRVREDMSADENQKSVRVYSFAEWKSNKAVGGFFVPADSDGQRFCRVDEYPDYLFGTVSIPDESETIDGMLDFFFYVTSDELIFVDDNNVVVPILDKLSQSKTWKIPLIDTLVYSFMEQLVDSDLHHLEELESLLVQLEDEVLEEKIEHFDRNMMRVRKELLARSRYYSQLLSAAQEFEENENDIFNPESERLFKLLGARILRLRESTQFLREYSMQIREVYQAQIDLSQNYVMKVLTVVTTIVLPLTLIAGWYGMNFKYMPTLTWKYGYPLVIAMSAALVVGLIWWFKNKKFF